MKSISKILTIMVTLSLFLAFCSPVSAQTDITKTGEKTGLCVDIFAKEKLIKSGDRAYFVAKVTDESGNPVADKTVLFYQNVEISGLSIDQYIGEARTDEKGIAIFRPVLSVAGDSGVMFVGCAAEGADGVGYYSDHIMITVTNPYPVVTEDEISN